MTSPGAIRLSWTRSQLAIARDSSGEGDSFPIAEEMAPDRPGRCSAALRRAIVAVAATAYSATALVPLSHIVGILTDQERPHGSMKDRRKMWSHGTPTSRQKLRWRTLAVPAWSPGLALLLVPWQHSPLPLDALAEHVLERCVPFAFLNVLRDC